MFWKHCLKRAGWYAAAALLVLAWGAYAPGLDGPFLYDDHANITSNADIKVDEITPAKLAAAIQSGRAGPFGRPISMASFAIDHARAGLNSGAFKRTNLVIHLICGLLVFSLSFLLARRIFWRDASSKAHFGLSLLVAGVWLIHPLQLTNVLYVVQRMNSLCGLFTLAALLCYCAARYTREGGIRRLGIGSLAMILALVLAATLSKENGLLVLANIAAIELSARYALPSFRCSADRVFLITCGAGAALVGFVLAGYHERLAASYVNRDFTLTERLLTEPRVLLWYLKLMWVPDITEMGLIHDDWLKSTGLMQPATTLAALAAWVSIGALAWFERFRQPLLLFALLWYLLGHSMESTFLPLLLVFEHRNYLPLFGVVFVSFAYVGQTLQGWHILLKAVLALIVLIALFAQTRERARVWSEDTKWIQAQARNHPNSPAAQYLKGDLLAQFASYMSGERREKLIMHSDRAFGRAWELNPRNVSALIARADHWQRLGLAVSESDLKRVTQQLSTNDIVPLPAQNTILTYCQRIRDGKVVYLGQLQDDVFRSLLSSPGVTVYIREPLEACVGEIAKGGY